MSKSLLLKITVFVCFFVICFKTASYGAFHVKEKSRYSILVEINKKENPRKMISRADMYMRHGKFVSAARLVKKFLSLFPSDKKINPILAAILAMGKQTSKAKFIMRDTQNSSKYYAYYYIARAYTALEEKKIDQAKSFALQAIKMDEKHPLAYDVMGTVLLKANKFKDAGIFFKKAISLEPMFSSGYSNLGTTFLSIRREREAIKYYKVAIKLNPENEKSFYGIALAYLAIGRQKEGVFYLKKCIELNGKLAMPYIKLANIYLMLGENSKALKLGKKILSLKKSKGGGFFIVARSLSQMGHFGKALSYVNLALEKNADNVKILDTKGYIQLALNMYTEALETFEKITFLNINRTGYYFPALPIAYIMAMKDVDASQKLLKKVERNNKYWKYCQFILAQLEIMKGSKEQADKYLRASTGLIPGFVVENLNLDKYIERNAKSRLTQFLAVLYLSRGWIGHAKRLESKVIENNPNDFIALYILGKLEEYTKSEEGKISRFKKALKIEPLIKFYVGKKKYGEAIVHYEAVAKASPQTSISKYALGSALYIAGQKKAAYKVFTQISEEYPYFAPAYNQMALLLIEMGGDIDKAMEVAKKADSLLPQSGNIKDTVGWIYFKKGRYKKARLLLDEALRLLPRSPTVCYHLGMLHKEVGLKKDSMLFFKTALSLSKNFPEKEACEAEMSSKE